MAALPGRCGSAQTYYPLGSPLCLFRQVKLEKCKDSGYIFDSNRCANQAVVDHRSNTSRVLEANLGLLSEGGAINNGDFTTDADYSKLDFIHPIVHCQSAEVPVFPVFLRARTIFVMSLPY
jgi:hypothetical protein